MKVIVEFVFSFGLARKRGSVFDFLTVLQTAGDAFIAVAVKCIKREGHTGYTPE